MTLLIQQLTLPENTQQAQALLTSSTPLLLRLGINFFAVTVLIRLIYYRNYRRSDLFLTFFTFNIIIFLITYLLNQVQMSIGAAFGLFAVFSMLRYRTEGLSAKDMTYLFVVIAMGLISSVSQGSWVQVTLINGLIVLVVQVLEGSWFFRREFSKTILYDRIEWIVPLKRADLMGDLRSRTGLAIHRVDIRDIDFLKDSAQITVYYYQHDTKPSSNAPAPETPAATGYAKQISLYE